MKKFEIFEAAGCCSTGVTNPEEKRNAIQFAVALNQLSSLGFDVNRYNLLSDTTHFQSNQALQQLLIQAPNALPICIFDGTVVKTHAFPSNEELATWFRIDDEHLEGKQQITFQSFKKEER
ncbi:arsenic metallochaperone ArsD family protein [Paenibacillus sp. 1P07SE]|uniref:arsenic metallochaperone ArsD family protein n=1 Tax=Paenibacillus sp. 1P07SE TaxID=3132209 RepID=UPI0039A67E39